ncbi:MAG: DMT family transporter [Methanomethylophilus sp.]|nr:DMT family transporter [Methanomethylophilus sp.]
MDRRKAVIIITLGCTLFGFLGVCARYFFAHGLNSFEVSFIRQSLTTLGLFLILLLTNRKLFSVELKDLVFMIAFGVMKLLSDVTLFYAQDNTTLALSSLLQMTFPYYVLVLSLFIFHERITGRKLIAMFVAFLGCMLVTGGFFNTGSSNVMGILSALFSGLCFGLYLIGNSIYVGKGKDPASYVFYCFLISTLVSFPLIDIGRTVTEMSSFEGIGYTLIFSLALTLLPMFLMAWSARFIEATTISVINMVEIVAAALVGFVFFGESLSASNILGMILVMSSVVILNIRIKKGAEKYMKEHGIKNPRQIESKT